MTDWSTEYSHARHTENTCQGTFSPTTHLQVPHQDNGQQAQGEIAQHRHHTVNVCDGDKLVDFQTGPMAGPIPEIRDRNALEGQHEPEHQAHRDRYTDDNPENHRMSPGDGETNESQCDRNLCNDASDHIGHLTEPPPLCNVRLELIQFRSDDSVTYKHGSLNILGVQLCKPLPDSIYWSYNTAGCKHDIHRLYFPL